MGTIPGKNAPILDPVTKITEYVTCSETMETNLLIRSRRKVAPTASLYGKCIKTIICNSYSGEIPIRNTVTFCTNDLNKANDNNCDPDTENKENNYIRCFLFHSTYSADLFCRFLHLPEFLQTIILTLLRMENMYDYIFIVQKDPSGCITTFNMIRNNIMITLHHELDFIRESLDMCRRSTRADNKIISQHSLLSNRDQLHVNRFLVLQDRHDRMCHFFYFHLLEFHLVPFH